MNQKSALIHLNRCKYIQATLNRIAKHHEILIALRMSVFLTYFCNCPFPPSPNLYHHIYCLVITHTSKLKRVANPQFLLIFLQNAVSCLRQLETSTKRQFFYAFDPFFSQRTQKNSVGAMESRCYRHQFIFNV